MKKEANEQQMPLPDQNQLFAAMSEQTRKRLQPLIELKFLKRDTVLYSPNSPLEHVHFPIDAIVAITSVVTSGATSEVSVVGNEGVVGILSLLSGVNTCTRAYVISEGFVYRLSKQAMQDEFNLHDSTMLLFLRYIQSLITQMTLTATCNRHHTIEQQFCKLLLLAQDRLPCNNLSLTQELVSNMFGVRREGITEAAIKLQKLNIITYHRGHITILNRTKLKHLSCECYEALRKETDYLLPTKPIDLPISMAYAARPGCLIDPKCIHCFKFGSCRYLKNNIKQATQKCVS